MKYNRLTHIEVKNAKPEDKDYKISDGNNLYLYVMSSGSKIWRLNYSLDNKRRQVPLGKYPVVSLADAREKTLEIQKLVNDGIDPVDNKRKERLDRQLSHENNFEAIAKEWHKNKKHTWQPKHADVILNRLSTNIFPIIGKRPINEIKPVELLHAIRPIEEAGKHEMAHRMLQTVGQILRYAVASGRTDRDVSQDLKGALKPVVSKNYAHLKESQLSEFIHKLNRYDSEYKGNLLTKHGFQLLILTFVRGGELRGAKWEEFDFDKKQWRIPAERMKMNEQHIVPLSNQSITLLKKIHKITGNSYGNLVFPSFKNPRKTLSENTFLRAIDIMGYKGITTGHGFRSTASTILNENGFRADIIERQLAHCERDQVRAAYNHAQYLPERTQMMQWWADHLEKTGMKV